MSPEFNYRVRDRSGNTEEGTVRASSRSEAARTLREDGYFVASLEEMEQEDEGEGGGFLDREIDLSFLAFWRGGLDTEGLAKFSEQFSVLISAGIPIVDALDIVREQTEADHFEQVLEEIISDIEGGEGFSSALQQHPDYFPSFFCQLIRAGETGGILDEVLVELAQHYRRQHEIKEDIKSALYYPVAIIAIAVAAIIFLLTFVVPEIMEIFDALDVVLPLPTLILIGMSNFMQAFWWLLLLAIVILFMAGLSFYRTRRGKLIFDTIILKIPLVGSLVLKISIARFSRTLALLLDSGVNLLSALPVVEEIVANRVIEKSLIEARGRLRGGVNISQPMRESGLFPPMVVQMIEVGEETGSLADMLNKVSGYYEMEVQKTIQGSISLIEPALIVFLAVVVGFIALSVVLPLFDLYAAL
ncbi:type II secretion system F family protein [Halarsenatibacter silvermanii]|uniref:Type IV pilus assembly protein PilC n=1 Tax=Halarsenatibacter silvermanii TaxID=321763 RepID=A0A1G9LAE0_9FIRM|nr:type II secretion system F family protein [Halarsenatibacter silvermanii]SDL58776.1 type IV pilus assembly protein PilC [Halarsenatibacter silvermanii]